MPRALVSIRGLPEWLIRDYLAGLGARPDGPAEAPRMRADAWTAAWSTTPVAMPGGAFSLTQFDIVFQSDDPTVLARIEQAFLKKAQRGGG